MSKRNLQYCVILLMALCLLSSACVSFKSPIATPSGSGQVAFIAPPKIPTFPAFSAQEEAAYSSIINAMLGWSQDVSKWGGQMAALKHEAAAPVFPDMPRLTKEEWASMTPVMREKILNYATEVTGWEVKLKRHHRELK